MADSSDPSRMTPKRGDEPREAGASETSFRQQLVGVIPHLRAFARSLCKDPTQADDLAQEALAKAWKARDSFEPGTSLKARTYMILRNQVYSEKRRSWRSTQRPTAAWWRCCCQGSCGSQSSPACHLTRSWRQYTRQ